MQQVENLLLGPIEHLMMKYMSSSPMVKMLLLCIAILINTSMLFETKRSLNQDYKLNVSLKDYRS